MNWTIGTAVVFAATSLLTGCADESGAEPIAGDDYSALGTEELKGEFNFLLEVDGVAAEQTTIIGGFKKMSGMDSESEAIELSASGGEITLVNGYADPQLLDWYRMGSGPETVRDLTLIQFGSEDTNKPVRISLLDSRLVELESEDEKSDSGVETLSIQYGKALPE